MDVRQVLPDARSVVSLSLNYFHPYDLPYQQPEQGVISRYASGEDYHEVLGKRVEELFAFIRGLEPAVAARLYGHERPRHRSRPEVS